MAEERLAVIIGIDEYDDEKITNLEGSKNDASDMYEILTRNENFKVEKHHFLLNGEASCRAIRKAISDLLWKTDPSDFTLFYFSGHGLCDRYSNGYIAPCDVSWDEPLVNGIDMRELKQIFMRSVNERSVMLLDCCHSGITTKGDRDKPSTIHVLDVFGELESEQGGEGKLILASSNAEDISREIQDCKHTYDDKAHCHGIFTYHLLQGLDFGAANETGDVNIGDLIKYVQKQFEGNEIQKPRKFVTNDYQADNILIAENREKQHLWIDERLTYGRQITKDNAMSNFIAADRINLILTRLPNHKEALRIKKDIIENFESWRHLGRRWIFDNEGAITELAMQMRFNIYPVLRELEKLNSQLTFDNIIRLEKSKRDLLHLLYRASIGSLDLKFFIESCKDFSNAISGSTLNVPRTSTGEV
ncbi:MAG: caspase domain-containing protein [Candidatus Hodarchaeota archaeon]